VLTNLRSLKALKQVLSVSFYPRNVRYANNVATLDEESVHVQPFTLGGVKGTYYQGLSSR